MSPQRRKKVIEVLKKLMSEYELRAKYNGGEDYETWRALDEAITELSKSKEEG